MPQQETLHIFKTLQRRKDSSNILYKPKGYESHWQHSQVLYNNGNNTSWPTDGVNGIKEVNSTFGRFYTSGQLIKWFGNTMEEILKQKNEKENNIYVISYFANKLQRAEIRKKKYILLQPLQ
ncbi:hypothetical protein J0383_00530 [Flavobacterium endoglycinae]|uniref:Uncharacterized protein n=1 Tax=Flavobacterium endoglycinae TaxID=2816357 RepID=A0ABX7QE40_9FLAO|nr:hypothetical protein [Flavobacterium endoglycinae]QSW89314.1 hypothetical protein J0383_00530 [Flavobacterium endoglycinae]